MFQYTANEPEAEGELHFSLPWLPMPAEEMVAQAGKHSLCCTPGGALEVFPPVAFIVLLEEKGTDHQKSSKS